MTMYYTSLIIDIKSSREFSNSDRYKAQIKLLEIINCMNKVFGKSMLRKFEFSSGDSIQALFGKTIDALNCFYIMENMFFPFQIWAGIGIGPVNNEIFNSSSFTGSNMIDGESYHMAIQAVQECKHSIVNCRILSYEKGLDSINDALEIGCRLKYGLTYKQKEIYSLFSIIFPLLPIDKASIHLYEELIDIKIKDYKSSAPTISEIKNTFLEMNENREFYNKKYITKLVSPIANLLSVSNENIRKIREAGRFDLIKKAENIVLDMLK